MNKKIIFAIAALLSISMLFTACGKKNMEERIRDVLTTNDSTYIEEENSV